MTVILYNMLLFGMIGMGIFTIVMGSAKKSFLGVAIGINITVLPVAMFIGIMATDAPTSTTMDFWKGFLFIQGIPIILLLIGVEVLCNEIW